MVDKSIFSKLTPVMYRKLVHVSILNSNSVGVNQTEANTLYNICIHGYIPTNGKGNVLNKLAAIS